ncbi:phosphoribosylanthranilate isomerase [Companilactobacillus zhongbaensis]|uniref:phosphoribosylanthranilate isomerase n=1 Tax=Companilactobacillus zhongbaensis TaxID=2486009 RepID=UPI000F79B3DF|nr:phosphoribosylanthranilate isomerase [Companilactobacillus zhongbaensis]
MTKIKICGLMNLDDIKAINQAKPDLAGFIFAGGRHHLDLAQALKMRQALDPSIKSVGVFVNAPVTEMVEAVESGAVSLIQLHGQESEDTVKQLQAKNIPVINVFKPDTINLNTAADYIMIDSGSGNGQLIDWQKLKITTKKPLIIAGALDINNLHDAINAIHPDFVDISRGVESAGQKNSEKILQIVPKAHALY